MYTFLNRPFTQSSNRWYITTIRVTTLLSMFRSYSNCLCLSSIYSFPIYWSLSVVPMPYESAIVLCHSPNLTWSLCCRVLVLPGRLVYCGSCSHGESACSTLTCGELPAVTANPVCSAWGQSRCPLECTPVAGGSSQEASGIMSLRYILKRVEITWLALYNIAYVLGKCWQMNRLLAPI